MIFKSFDNPDDFIAALKQESKQIRERKPAPIEKYPKNSRDVIETAARDLVVACAETPNGRYKSRAKDRQAAEQRLRTLGEYFNALGGMPLMQAIYAAVEDVHPELRYANGSPMRCLEALWSGIGEWEG